jgi:glycosyltransferase involved in cell wall biosynthesis
MNAQTWSQPTPEDHVPSSTQVPFVSVCIPCRNGAKELPFTLSNLLEHSSYPADRFEVLIGDHGSTDGTAAVVEAWSGGPTHVARIPVPFTGQNRAQVRNCLIRAARGEILVFIDHDILVSDDFLKEHVLVHREFPGALVAAATYGKGPFKQELEHLLDQLDLTHISSRPEVLEAHADFRDARLGSHLSFMIEDSREISSLVVPCRLFWSCNISANRRDIDECGMFDERYEGWGIEDDDFAHQFYSQNRQLVFSRRPWAFHVPHPAKLWQQLVSWRRNFDLLFAKFATRELEYFSVQPINVESAVERFEALVSLLPVSEMVRAADEASKQLMPSQGRRRLCHFVVDVNMARQLHVTDALIPTLGLKQAPRQEGDIRAWPLLGMKTPFADQSIDEALLLVDVLMLLDEHTLCMVFAETCRISKSILVCAGSASRCPSFAPAVAKFSSMMDRFRFSSVVILGTDDWRPSAA